MLDENPAAAVEPPESEGIGPTDSSSQPIIPVAADDRTFIQLIPQFFIFPLVLVTVGVLVYVFFIAAAQDHKPTSELLDDIRAGWLQTKNRSAFELAMRAHELEGAGEHFTVDETRQIVSILQGTPGSTNSSSASSGSAYSGDVHLRAYLVLALGRAGAPELALPELLKALEGSGIEYTLEAKVGAIRGLGLSRSVEVIDPLLTQLKNFPGDDSWEVRENILGAVTNIAAGPDVDAGVKARVSEVLRKHLEDPRWSTRWNAALFLATHFRDPSGVETLRDLLDREFLKEKFTEEGFHFQTTWMIAAVQALIAVRDVDSYPTIQSLSSDQSAQVRNAVFLSRETMESKLES